MRPSLIRIFFKEITGDQIRVLLPLAAIYLFYQPLGFTITSAIRFKEDSARNRIIMVLRYVCVMI